MNLEPTVVFVPGLRDHVADHWQTRLAAQIPGSRTVPPLGRGDLDCAARIEALDRVVAEVDGPVALVAHSAGVVITGHWAQRYRRRVHAALLATPPDLESPLPDGHPGTEQLRANGWIPIPRNRLDFPSIVAASTDDPLARYERVAQFADDWGSHLVNLGPVGHLNPAAGYGEWPAGADLVAAMLHLGHTANG
ncbi:RBBP9/YdeN family alpha/beta hydrolase [Nocardia sp. CA-151230]|uniref:RBBP9/YdeN family alpha/beta hydrolase n=1 Tax=Nocardia sp. CA-151230 TaxID=3239982 RepID=UPI003D941A41